NFKRSAELISNLTPDDTKVTIKQEQNNQPITSGEVLELTKYINVVYGRIMSSNQSRSLLRYEIRA
ncbi:2768_t:CDS:1, partial [Diversispora eburnea]